MIRAIPIDANLECNEAEQWSRMPTMSATMSRTRLLDTNYECSKEGTRLNDANLKCNTVQGRLKDANLGCNNDHA